MATYKALEILTTDTAIFDLQSSEVKWIGASSIGSFVYIYQPQFGSAEAGNFNLVNYSNGPLLKFEGSNNELRFYPDQDDTTNYCSIADTELNTYNTNNTYVAIYCSWDYANGNAVLRLGSLADTLTSITGWSAQVGSITLSAEGAAGVGGLAGEFYHDSIFRYATVAEGTPNFDKWDFASMYIFDDFEDGDDSTYTAGQSISGRDSEYPTWTVNDGTWKHNSGGYLEKTVSAGVWENIYVADTNFDDVIWEFDFKLNSTDSSSTLYFSMVNETDWESSGTADGYMLQVGGHSVFNLWRIDNGSITAIIDPAGSEWTGDTNWHNAKIIHKTGGLWEIILDGISIGFAYDNTYITMTYIVIYSRGINSRIDNIHVKHLHSKEFNSLETLNYDNNVLTTSSTMSSKSYDIVRFRYIDNSNTEKSIDIGRVVVGAYTSPARHYSIDYNDVMEDASSIMTTESGAEYFISRPNKRRFTLTFKRAGDAQDDQMETVFESIGNTKPIVISIDPDNHPEEVIYARLVRPFERRRGISKRATYVLEFIELL